MNRNALAWGCAALLFCGDAWSAELPIGAKAPDWTNLAGIDGKPHAIADLEKQKVVVVIFFDNTCPDCQTYLSRIIGIAREFETRQAAFVLLNVSPADSKENDLEAMMRFAKEKKITAAYLRDPSQKIGKAFGAAVTPTAFVLDKERRLAYRGAIDDHWKPEKVQRRHLKLAVDQVLAGKTVEMPVTKAQGCDIEYNE